jgi:hypothetical protein
MLVVKAIVSVLLWGWPLVQSKRKWWNATRVLGAAVTLLFFLLLIIILLAKGPPDLPQDPCAVIFFFFTNPGNILAVIYPLGVIAYLNRVIGMYRFLIAASGSSHASYAAVENRSEKVTCYQCDPRGVDRKVVKLEQGQGVETYHLECGHTSSRFFRTLVQGITVTDSVAQSLIINPIGEIEQSLKNEDYFKAATYLSAVLEYYGRLAVDEKLRAEKREINRARIDRLSLQAVAILLYALGIVEQPCYSALIELNRLRRDLLHFRDVAEFRIRQGSEAEVKIRRALECIGVLAATEHAVSASSTV